MARRLAAIMFTDMVGSTQLAQTDEQAALRLLQEQEELAGPVLAAHHGRLVKSTGDGMLVEFGNALEAVQCAVELQRQLQARGNDNRAHPLKVRIGIHTGDVEDRGTDIFGDAVNVASRVEPLADPGGICLSGVVLEHVRNKVPYAFESLGPKSLKGVLRPVMIYRVALPWRRAEPPAPPEQDRTRVAVLPFANMSPDPGDEYFADGMTEELIDRLGQTKRLAVIARTSVMSYKKTSKRAAEIANELSVGTLVEGSFRKAGDRVRITVQLINAGTEEHLWSDRYDRDFDDIFAVQTEIAVKVAGELSVRLIDSERQALERKPTENTEAYALLLRGRELYREGSTLSVRQALNLHEKAIELDPRFAQAHVGIADCHQALREAGVEPREISLPLVKASLQRALKLDSDLAEAHAALAKVYLNEDNGPAWEAEARRALELNPSLPEAHNMLSQLVGLKGDPDEMVREAEVAFRLAPLNPEFIDQVGTAYLGAGREKEALEHWEKTEHLAPRITAALRTEYYLSKGDLGKAEELYETRKKLSPSTKSPWLTYMGGILRAHRGKKEEAVRIIRELEDDPVLRSTGLTFVGAVYAALGDLDSCFDYLNRALEAHTLVALSVMYSPLFARARSDPRYQGLVDKLRRRIWLGK